MSQRIICEWEFITRPPARLPCSSTFFSYRRARVSPDRQNPYRTTAVAVGNCQDAPILTSFSPGPANCSFDPSPHSLPVPSVAQKALRLYTTDPARPPNCPRPCPGRPHDSRGFPGRCRPCDNFIGYSGFRRCGPSDSLEKRRRCGPSDSLKKRRRIDHAPPVSTNLSTRRTVRPPQLRRMYPLFRGGIQFVRSRLTVSGDMEPR